MNIALLIPAYNAELSLGELLERSRKFIPAENIIVVNDGSTDGTGKIPGNFGAKILSHQQNRGKGAALRTGFDFVVSAHYDAVITMDADLQHQPEDIPAFIHRYHLHHEDVIIGTRKRSLREMPVHRLFSNAVTTFLVGARTGLKITDSQSGFRFVAADVLRKIDLLSAGFEMETEFIIKAAAAGCSFGSIPIAAIYAGEKSHMTHFSTTLNFIKVLFKQY